MKTKVKADIDTVRNLRRWFASSVKMNKVQVNDLVEGFAVPKYGFKLPKRYNGKGISDQKLRFLQYKFAIENWRAFQAITGPTIQRHIDKINAAELPKDAPTIADSILSGLK